MSQETLFFDDITRLANDMFSGDMFAQYLPLFNIWAVYLPSIESVLALVASQITPSMDFTATEQSYAVFTF